MMKNMISSLKAGVLFFDENLEKIALVVLCLALVLSLTFTVVVRFAFHSATLSMISHQAEEMALFSFVWLLYFGASYATKQGQPFRITVQFNFLPDRFKKYALMPGSISWFLFNLLIIKLGWDLMQDSMETSLAMEIPLKAVYAIIPVSFILITYRLIQEIYRTIKTPLDQGKENV